MDPSAAQSASSHHRLAADLTLRDAQLTVISNVGGLLRRCCKVLTNVSIFQQSTHLLALQFRIQIDTAK